jgi:SAM-dependent methyltransferase
MVAACDVTVCPVCGTDANYRLPVPSASQAVLSDGRIITHCLAKAGCGVCGAVYHARRLDRKTVSAFFDDAYFLPSLAPAGARKRATAYAGWLGDVLGDLQDAAVLEVGAGSGLFLEALGLRYQGMRGLGLDPAAPAPGIDLSSAMAVRRGRLTSLKVNETNFDLIVAINVIEHVPDPGEFLRMAAARLRQGGRMAIVCPDGANADEELLFYDHLTSFTPNAFSRLAAGAGLSIVACERAPSGIGSFRLFLLAAALGPSSCPAAPLTAIRDMRMAYLAAWRDLDANMAARTGRATTVRMFGAGQTAALLRAYAPLLWSQVATLLLDDPGDAWPLGLPVQSYGEAKADPDAPIIVAVSPAGQAAVANRLSAHGHRAITWDDLIPRVGE